MSANLYKTKNPGEFYHIHGSLDASTTLMMIGLKPFRPDLEDHDAIVNTIESAVQRFTIDELEQLNVSNRQAGIPALTHDEFLQTPHVCNLTFAIRYSPEVLLIINKGQNCKRTPTVERRIHGNLKSEMSISRNSE